ncbi:MAG: GxxExxY protein [Phycisphaeraceae bacterium]|nr:GxxExxY protein [Phycisphaeraceae bacterium]
MPEALNKLSERVIGCAIEVHRALGPGLLERMHEEALCHEFKLQGIAFDRQVPVRLRYKGIELVGQRFDLLVAGLIVVELKAVEQVIEVHLAQLVSYLRAGPFPLGLLINFNTPALRQGIERRVNSKAFPLAIPDQLLPSATSA